MNVQLIEKAKKYKIALTGLERKPLPNGNSAKEWLKTIEDFLTKHNLLDATIEIETGGCYECCGGLNDIYVQAVVDRSEEAIQKDVQKRDELEKLNRQEARERAKQRKFNDLRELARLKKKYENSN